MIGVSSDLFLNIGIVIIIAAVTAYLLRIIKQPQILAYVLVGILITPIFKIVTDVSIIESMSLIGIIFLLFIVGLEINFNSLKNVALISTVGGSIQIILLFVLGYTVSLLMGFLNSEAAYIGLALTFSSTMVVMKLLSDRRELNTLHGRIIVGILLIEDVVAIFAISILSSLNSFSISSIFITIFKLIVTLLIAYLMSKFIFPRIFRFAAKNHELLLISSLAVCFLFSVSFYYLKLSIVIGAFIAGVALGNLEYNTEIIGKVKSLKDFFSLLFFVSLGMGLSLIVIKRMWFFILLFFILIIIVKPFIIMTICSLFKYTKKPAFLTANSLGQIGEFSLILAAQGLAFSHISQELFSSIVIITLASITVTSYTLKYNNWIYNFLKKPLKIFDIFTTEGLEYLPSTVKPNIILCGYNRIGYSILRRLKKIKKSLLIIDFNPEVISKLVKDGYHCIYGDVSDEEIIERMNLKQISILISTVPEESTNLLIIKKTRAINKKAKIIVTSSQIDSAIKLYNQGADYVILPHFLGGEHASHLISKMRTKKIKLKEERKKHLQILQERKKEGHEHPQEEGKHLK